MFKFFIPFLALQTLCFQITPEFIASMMGFAAIGSCYCCFMTQTILKSIEECERHGQGKISEWKEKEESLEDPELGGQVFVKEKTCTDKSRNCVVKAVGIVGQIGFCGLTLGEYCGKKLGRSLTTSPACREGLNTLLARYGKKN